MGVQGVAKKTIKPICTVVIPSRDGEITLPQTLESLLAQDVPIKILVADDHSIDNTPMILEKFRDRGIETIRYPTREPRDYARVPILLNMLKPLEPDTPFYMVSGDDTVYTSSYIRLVTEYMTREKIALASGKSVEYPGRNAAPGGSGRIFTKKVWDKVTPFYPNIAWETGALYKTRKEGHNIGFYSDATKSHIRPQTSESTRTFGHAAFLLGTPITFTFFRIIKILLVGEHSFNKAVNILIGQFEYELKRPPRVDIWPYVRQLKYTQRNQGIKTILKRAGRKILKAIIK